MTPRFSIIIPVFNGAKTISKAIESALNQSYPAYEIIVVDDGSEDDTSKVVQSYVNPEHSRVRYFRQANAGVSAARNFGVRQAKADWLTFLDADDWYFPDRLKYHADWITEDPHLDFLTGDQIYVRQDGSIIGYSMEKTVAGRKALEVADDQERALMEVDLIGEYVSAHFGDMPTLSLKRSTFLKLGGFPTDYAICEDMHFVIRLCTQSKRVGVICRPLAAYVIHDASATRSDPLRAQQQSVAALQSLKSELINAPQPIRLGWARALHGAKMDYAVALLRIGNKRSAMRVIVGSYLEQPSWRRLRDLLSVFAACFSQIH